MEELGFSTVAELVRNVRGTKMVRLQAAGPVMVVLSEEGDSTVGNTASSEVCACLCVRVRVRVHVRVRACVQVCMNRGLAQWKCITT